MKRTELKRGTSELKRSAMKQSRKRLPARNAKRRDAAWEKAYHSEAFCEFTRMSPSSATGERGPCVCSHSAKSRAAGGTYRDVVPLTDAEHRYEHLVGVVTAWREWGRDPVVEAREHWERWLSYSGMFWPPLQCARTSSRRDIGSVRGAR